ncbi:MAG: Hpt domain-containing protein [Lachnospiraceae bacterium]|nr:Hpt domain-containing protein [Lachnospiraceae bacterium]
MTLREVYGRFGGDYDEILGRMMREAQIRKYLLRFPGDESFGKMCRAYEEERDAEAFENAHVLKGVCLSLGLGRLTDSVSGLVEALRNGRTPEAPAYYERTKADYASVTAAIADLDRED